MNTAEEKIFEGCKHPELIDEYIRGVKEGAKQSQLQALKEEVEPLKMLLDSIQTSRKGSIGSIDNVYLPQLSVKSVKEAREALNLITNLEDNE